MHVYVYICILKHRYLNWWYLGGNQNSVGLYYNYKLALILFWYIHGEDNTIFLVLRASNSLTLALEIRTLPLIIHEGTPPSDTWARILGITLHSVLLTAHCKEPPNSDDFFLNYLYLKFTTFPLSLPPPASPTPPSFLNWCSTDAPCNALCLQPGHSWVHPPLCSQRRSCDFPTWNHSCIPQLVHQRLSP